MRKLILIAIIGTSILLASPVGASLFHGGGQIIAQVISHLTDDSNDVLTDDSGNRLLPQ